MIKFFLVVDESLHKWQLSACLETLQPKPQSLGYHQCQRRELFEHCQILRTPWHCHSLRMSRGIFFIRKFFGIFLSFLKKNFKCFFLILQAARLLESKNDSYLSITPQDIEEPEKVTFVKPFEILSKKSRTKSLDDYRMSPSISSAVRCRMKLR